MSKTEDTTGNGKNIGGIGRNRGPRAGSDLSGGVTRVEGEKGLETADRPRTYAPDVSRYRDSVKGGVLDKIGDFARRMVGDPVGLIEREALLDAPRPLDNHSRPVELIGNHIATDYQRNGETIAVVSVAHHGQPDAVRINGQRYVHEERVEEARREYRGAAIKPTPQPSDDMLLLALAEVRWEMVRLAGGKRSKLTFAEAAKIDKATADAMDTIAGLRDDVRAAEKGADDWKRLLNDAKDGWDKAIAETKAATKVADEWKTRATEAQKAYLAAEAKVAELSKVRVFNVAGLVEKDLAERYESLRESFAKLQADMIERNHELAEARALIAESAPVVRYVERLASLSDEDADTLDARDIRMIARDNFANREAWESALDPRTYTDEQREAAIKKLRSMVAPGVARSYPLDRLVDRIAETLGMRRMI